MKKIAALFFSLSVIVIPGFAHDVEPTCEGEAQIIAVVAEVETDSLMTCKAIVNYEDVQVFNSSQVCPLSLQTIVTEGVNFPLINGHDCEVRRGDEISGVVGLKNGQPSMSYQSASISESRKKPGQSIFRLVRS